MTYKWKTVYDIKASSQTVIFADAAKRKDDHWVERKDTVGEGSLLMRGDETLNNAVMPRHSFLKTNIILFDGQVKNIEVLDVAWGKGSLNTEGLQTWTLNE